MSETGKTLELNKLPFKTRVRPYLIVAPALVITIGIMIPFIMAIYLSLTNYSFRRPSFSFIAFQNWSRILSSREFWHALWVTIQYAFFSTVVEMPDRRGSSSADRLHPAGTDKIPAPRRRRRKGPAWPPRQWRSAADNGCPLQRAYRPDG